MKNLFKWGLLASLSSLMFVGCASDAEDVLNGDDIVIGDTVDEYGNPIDVNGNSIATVRLTEEGVGLDTTDDKISTTIEGEAGGIVTGLVVFTSTTKQKRLYVTQTLPGESAMPFEIDELTNKGTKADGSIDLDGDTKESIEFAFDLNVPDSVEDGSIIYNFWSTTGKGDFRDASKRLLLGVASIEVKVGDGIGTSDAAVREINGVKLNAPDSGGSTAAFFSLLTGEEYVVISVDGNENSGPEYRFLWDMGYYYTTETGFASTNNYSNAFPFEVEGFEASSVEIQEGEVLNNMYFATSAIDFDTVSVSSDLDNITSSGNEKIEGMVVGSVIQFVDNYGKKGLIKITGLEPGYALDDYITFDVKIQP